jgi:hypothetical protein
LSLFYIWLNHALAFLTGHHWMRNIDLLTLARNARTSVEMVEKFYASTLSAEMNVCLLHSKRA